MPYLGNNPTANFASVTKDTFSGNASTTAFTLSKPATTNGVAVYVENVRQIPTTAYAVSGTTLTFTGAPPSGTNNIYVMHHNTPVSTATHPSAQALTATSGTFTGAFTSVGIDDNADATTMTIDSSENVGIGNTSPSSQYVTRLVVGDGSGTEGITIYSGNDSMGRLEFSDATSGDGRYAGGIVYEHNNNKLRFNTNGGNERMSIDSNGIVSMPLQPAVIAYNNGNNNVSFSSADTYEIVQFNIETIDRNADYASSQTFTAPVDGTYYTNANVLRTATSSGSITYDLAIYVNSTLTLYSRHHGDNSGSNTSTQNVTGLVDLDSGDTLQVYARVSDTKGQRYQSQTSTYFHVFLLG